MKHKLVFLLVPLLLLGACNSNPGGNSGNNSGSSGGGADPGSLVPIDDANEYDAWLDSWSQPNHLYFHYNRGSKGGYENYCLWLWQHAPQDLEGALYAFSANPVVNAEKNVELKPMTTHWMTAEEVGKEGNKTYLDTYGVIADVDLGASNLVGGKTGTPTTFDDMSEIGFLLPLQSKMDGSSNWVSDGGRETYLDDISNAENWRTVEGGKAIHIFVSTGALYDYSYRVGDGTAEAVTNPIELDTTGQYRSDIDAKYSNNLGVSTTSEAFKELGVGYQVFVASFRDSNGDGIGDIRGVIDSLDYLSELGAQVLWLTPIQKSDSYHGYDISDYFAVDKRFGTVEDYRELLYKAHQKGMKVLMDLVLNHTSKGNVWFINSQWGVKDEASGINWRDVYSWKYATDRIDKYNPTTKSYESITVQEDAESDSPSWYRDGESNYYYYGKFGSGMPEINYLSESTRKLVIDMAKYWMSFGLDGFRLDAVKHIFMRDECFQPGDYIITDVGSKESYDDEKGRYVTKAYDYSSNLTKNMMWWKEFAQGVKADYPDCFLVGENFDGWGTRTAPYYQAMDSQFSFATYYHICSYLYSDAGSASHFDNQQAKETFIPFSSYDDVTITNNDQNYNIPGGSRPDFIDGAFTSNHDVMRAINQANGSGATVMDTTPMEKVDGSGDQVNKAKIHAAITLLNPGVSWIYYGDELGMSSNTDSHVATYGSKNCEDIWYRQPFLWSDTTKRANYKSGQYKFELDSYNSTLKTVEQQMQDSNSMYKWYKDLIEIKKQYPKGAKLEYKYSSGNVLGLHVYGQGKELWIYINTGRDQSSYLMDPGAGFTNIKAMGGAPSNVGGDIGSVKWSVSAFKKQEDMTMKKKILFLLIPLLACGLSSCVLYNGQGKPGKSKVPSSSIPSEDSSVTPPDPTHHDIPDDSKEGDKITVYLVFGQYGLYENQPVTSNEESLFLEHVKKMTDMAVGADLPGKDKVTSSVEGSIFQSWVMYKNDGKLTEYTKVPAIDNAVLYASFSGGKGGGSSSGGSGGGSSGGDTPSTGEFTPATEAEASGTGYGFKFFGAHEAYMAGEKAEDFDGFQQYKFTNRAFKKNQQFALYDFGSGGTWTVNVDPYSFGGSSTNQEEWKKYLSNDGSKYTVLQDFNSSEIYIKIKYGQDQVYIALG